MAARRGIDNILLAVNVFEYLDTISPSNSAEESHCWHSKTDKSLFCPYFRSRPYHETPWNSDSYCDTDSDSDSIASIDFNQLETCNLFIYFLHLSLLSRLAVEKLLHTINLILIAIGQVCSVDSINTFNHSLWTFGMLLQTWISSLLLVVNTLCNCFTNWLRKANKYRMTPVTDDGRLERIVRTADFHSISCAASWHKKNMQN